MLTKHKHTFKVGDIVTYDWYEGVNFKSGDQGIVQKVYEATPATGNRILFVKWLESRSDKYKAVSLFEYKFIPGGGPW